MPLETDEKLEKIEKHSPYFPLEALRLNQPRESTDLTLILLLDSLEFIQEC